MNARLHPPCMCLGFKEIRRRQGSSAPGGLGGCGPLVSTGN